MTEVFHLDLTRKMLKGATLAIVPGDPARSESIAEHMDDPVFLASKREYTSWLGHIEGRPVVVCSTGIGGPSTSIAVEELAQLGVRTFLRVGTTGAIQPDIAVGDVIVTQASVRLDGASTHFAPIEYPAASNFECTSALVNAAEQLGLVHHVGITASSDTFSRQRRRMAIARRTELRDGIVDPVDYVRNPRLAGRVCHWRAGQSPPAGDT